ncbi:MAG: amidohydrolase family protein [Acidimicrobiales bacterium]|nr:amidohydrolase family protein [Acidimicrobiales bacterium]
MDLLLRNGIVVDGTGAPARPADVGVAGGRVVAVTEPGSEVAAGAEVVDLDGLALAPGFVDIHTHYDAQITWDPDLSPSCWHGVTTVVMGNCGFSVAPTRPEHRELVARTLENVEGMSLEALRAGIRWDFSSFGEYLDSIERHPVRLNVGALVGHTALRLFVMGDDATERAATPAEVAAMRVLLAGALSAGALGFATSKLHTHHGAHGRPVPSRLAAMDELLALVAVLGEQGRGVVQATFGPGFNVPQFAELAAASGRPVTWTALLTGIGGPGKTREIVEQTAAAGGEVWPQVACRPLVMQITLEDPFPFGTVPAFSEVLAAPRERRADLYADPAWRDRARPVITEQWGRRWSKTTVQETVVHAVLRDGPNLAELAAARGLDPFDLLCDLALEEDLATRFRIVLANDDEDELAGLLRDPRVVLGLSDAGAHASQLCDACFSTHLLGHWVRERQVLTLEEAVWRLSGQPARVFRVAGRGRIAEGFAADLVAFDPATVGPGPLERVHDLPGGADRLVARGVGVHDVWVNGTAIRRRGDDLPARPGALVRGVPG